MLDYSGKQKQQKLEYNEKLIYELESYPTRYYEDAALRYQINKLKDTLKQRINTLYNENKEIIDIIAARNDTPGICLETIKSFVNLRNGKTHSGIFIWNENAKLFYPLFTLVYACLLNYIGVDDETIKDIITCVF